MTLGNPNTEAYEIMADIVVTMKRIVHRGLVKASGETWYLDGLPPELYEKLVARKESEIAIDRFDDEYQELISYASFDDLADTIEFNRDLAELLAWLALDGTSIVDQLREIESLRLKLEAFVPFTDDDLESVIGFHQNLGQMLKRRKVSTPEVEEAEASEPVDMPEEDVDEIFAEEDSGDHEEEEVDVDVDTVIEDTEDAEETEDTEDTVETEVTEDAEDTDTLDEVVEVDVVEDDLSTQFAEIDELSKSDVIEPEDFGTVAARLEVSASSKDQGGVDSEDAVAVERAMASDDDREVLRILRREVMSVAESMLQNDPEEDQPVWETIRSSGWYEIKRDALGIEAVEKFYEVAEGVVEKRVAGHSSDEVKDYLDESEFSRMLLSLREMFLQHNL